MKTKKGMYVRTKITDNCNNVYIVKITEIDEDNKDLFYIDEDIYDCWGDAFNFIEKDDIKKASYDIIDLIEVGDYVNERFVSKYNGELGIFEILESNWKFEKIEDVIKDYGELWIVTREQFDNIKYEVE